MIEQPAPVSTPHGPTTVAVAVGGGFLVVLSGWATWVRIGPLLESWSAMVLVLPLAVVWWLLLAGMLAGLVAVAGHPRRTTALTAVAVLLAGGVAIGHAGISPRAGLTVGVTSPEDWFADHRADFERAQRELEPSSTYLSVLPDDLAYLSTDGRFTRSDGTLFFAQWYGFPDDAGGYFHSEAAPAGQDMSGMLCVDPVDLGGSWWSCGQD